MKKLKRFTHFIKYGVMLLVVACGVWMATPAGYFIAGAASCLVVVVALGSQVVQQKERRWRKWLMDAVEY